MPTHIPLKSVTHIMLKGVELAGDRDVSQEKRIPAGQPNAGEWMDTAGEEAAYADEWKKKLANDDAIDVVPLLDENAEKPRSVENYAYGKVKAVLKADPSLAMYGITALFPQPDLSDAGLEALTVLGEKGDKWYSKWRSRLASHDVSSIPGMTARKLTRVFGVMGDGTSPRDDYAYTLRAMDRLRHDLWRSPEDVEMLEKDGLLGKFGTYGIDPEEIDGAIHDQPLPRVINTRTGLTNKKLGVDYSKATDFRKLYNYTQGVLGKGGVAVDVWMTRMFFRADTAPNRYQYDYVEGRVKHMAEVLSKKTGKPYTSEDVQAMLWVGYKGFIANKLKGYQEIIRAHGNDAAKKLLKPLDAAVEQSMTPGDADSIITYSGMMKDPDADAAYNKITGFDENSSREINPIPYLTVHKVIEENRDALVKLIDDDTVKNGYQGHKDIFGNINAAIEIYKAHLDEFDEKHISLEYSTSATGERVVSAVGAKGEIAKMFRSFMPKASVFEIKSSKTKGTNIDSFKEGQIGFGYTYGNKSVAGVADPEKMKAAMEADPKLKAGLLLIAGMLKTKAKAKAGHKSDDLGTALAKMAVFAGLTYPHEVPKGIGLSYEPEINAPSILDGSLPVSGDPSAAAGRNELSKGASDDGRADETSGLSRGLRKRGSAGSRLDDRGRDADLGRRGSGSQSERVGTPTQTILIKGLAEARIPKGQPHGGEWAKGSGGAKNEYADKRMDVLPLHSISHQYETAPLLGAMFGYAAQPEYPPITSRLENRLLMPAPPHAPDVLAKYLSAHNIDFEGILPNLRPEYRPDLVGLPNSVTGVPIATQWDGLTDVEKAGRVAASTLQAFDAMESVIRVDGTANPAKNRLNVIIEDLQKKESVGSVLGGSYDPVKNLLSIDLTAADSLIHEFGHYLDTSANAGLEPASHVKTAWLALAQSMNDTAVHEHFAQNVVAAGASMNYIQTPTEMIARLFEGYVMHETLKRGVDIAPAFISPMRGGVQPTLATAAGRELLNFEPYTYQQYEEFGGTLMGLLRSASLTKGLGLDNAVLVLVDSLVKSVRDVSGEKRDTDGKWTLGSGYSPVETIEDPALLSAYKEAIYSPSFKAWFGEWEVGVGSQVKGVDGKPAVNTHTHSVALEDGEPVVAYHGTSQGGFSTFDKSKLDPDSLWGAGFYFTQDEGIAESYTNKDGAGISHFKEKVNGDELRDTVQERIRALYPGTNDENPKAKEARVTWAGGYSHQSDPLLQKEAIAKLNGMGIKTDDLLEWTNVQNDGKEVKKVFLNIRRPLDLDAEIGKSGYKAIMAASLKTGIGSPTISRHTTGETAYQILRRAAISSRVGNEDGYRPSGSDVAISVLKGAGFDGLTHIGGDRMGNGEVHHRVWIAWEPNQIKAVENEGAFSTANANIYKGALVKSAHDVSGESRDDNGKWVKGSGAPQVPPAELSQAYSKAIQLPAFKAWFGEWQVGVGSKVKTEDGKPAINTHTHSVVEEGGVPVVVFHGTANGGFTTFDKAKLDPGALWGAGFYFTQDMGVGTSYKEKGGTKVELSRPIDTDDLKKVIISLRRRPTVWATSPISDYEVDDLDSMLSDRHMDDESKADILEDYIKSNDTYSHDIAAWLGVTPLTSGPELKKAFLNIRNPIDIDVPIGEAGLREIKEYLQGHKERTYISLGATSDGDTLEFTIPEINNSVRLTAGMSGQDLYHAVNKAVRIAVGRQVITQDENGVPSVSPQSVFHRMGFDGITHIGGDRMGNGDSHRVWIAWEPNQVKAVENEGTFDPASEDMYKGLSLVILSKSAHDVSGEKRDTDGKWVRGSGIPRVPPTELAQAYSKAVQSKAFKAWFGDWDTGEGSKVKGKDGKPAVNTHTHSVVEEGGVPVTVFHGTAHGGFRAFDKAKLDPDSLWGAGFYFTQDVGVGTSYKDKDADRINLTRKLTATDLKKVLASLETLAPAWATTPADWYEKESLRSRLSQPEMGVKGKVELLTDYIQYGLPHASEIAKWLGASDGPTAELKKAFLNIRNPLDIDQKIGRDGLEAIAKAWNLKTEKTPMNVPAATFTKPVDGGKPYLKLWQPGGDGNTTLTEYYTGADIYDTLKNSRPEDQTYTEVLERMGFDGITHIGGNRVGRGNSHRVWIAWEPNQIKAVENEGTFDPSNPDMYKGASLVVLAKGLTPHLSHMAYAGGLHNSALVRSACQHVNEAEVGIKGKDGKLIACTYCPDCLRVKSVDKSRHGHACNDAPLDVADMQEGDEQGGDSLRKAADPKAADLKDTDASGKAVKTGAKKPGDVSEDCYKNPESCQLKWITAHPDGELGRGVPLLVHDNGEEYTVVGGAGGKLNQLVFKKPTAQQTIDKKGKNVEREKMKQQRIFAAREQLGDKGVELEQRKAALDTQAKEQLKGIQNKAIAKMGIQFEGSDAVKAITDEARARAIKLNPNASPEEQEQLANAAVKQARSDAKDAVKRLTQHALDRAAMRSLGVADGGDSEKFAADIAGRKILKDMSNEDLDDFVGDIAALSQTKAMSRAVAKVLNSGRASAIDGIVASVQPISDEDAKKQNLAQYLDGRSVNVNTALVRGSELASPATQHRLQAMSASDAINSIVSEHTGQAILGPETIQALGIENSARVAAAYLVKHGNSGKAIGDALEQQVATGAYAAESAALSQVDELNVIVAHAKDSAGVGTVTQNQASIVAANMAVQSYRILNTCRGQIRATSGVAHFLESGLGGDLELPVGGTLSEGRAQAKAFGLQDGDFDIREAQTGEGGGYILHVAEDKLDKLAQPHDAGASARSADMDRLRADVEASPGHYTPQGWNTVEGGPTLAPYQELATRGILQNKHLLLNYGAGVGKTPIYLAAAMDALATGKVDRVLMTSPQKPLSQLIKGDDDKPNGEAGFFLSPEAAAQIAVVSGGASLKAALEDLKSGKKKMIAMTPVTMRDHMDELKAAGFGGEKSMYIADEAHYFATGAGEGKGSAMARSAREMAGSEYAVYGTGSAVDNDGSELHSLYNDLHPGELGPQKAFASEWLRLSGGSSNLHEGMAMRGMRDRLSGGMLSEFKPVTDKKTGREIKLTNTDKPVTLYPEQVEAIKVINAQYLVDKKSPDSGKATAAALVRDAHKRAVMDNGVPGADGKMRSAKGDAADEIARSEKAINPQNRIGIYSQTLAPARNAADKIIQSGTMKNFVSITGAEDEAATRKSLAALNDRTNDTDGVILSDAANLGVNGQGMDNIVKMGPMLTAGRENQLNHRHYRKGQTRDVRTTTLIANDPLDEIAQYRVKNTKGKQFALLASMMDDTGVAGLLTQHLDTIMKVAGSGDAAGEQPNT